MSPFKLPCKVFLPPSAPFFLCQILLQSLFHREREQFLLNQECTRFFLGLVELFVFFQCNFFLSLLAQRRFKLIVYILEPWLTSPIAGVGLLHFCTQEREFVSVQMQDLSFQMQQWLGHNFWFSGFLVFCCCCFVAFFCLEWKAHTLLTSGVAIAAVHVQLLEEIWRGQGLAQAGVK